MYWSRGVMVAGPKIFCKEVMVPARFLCLFKFLRSTVQDQVDKKHPKIHVVPFFLFVAPTEPEFVLSEYGHYCG